jgi:hypothetical protein
MSEIIIDEYHLFRYRNDTPESTAQAASKAALLTTRIGSDALRWSAIGNVHDVMVTDEPKPFNQSIPIVALALEFTSPSIDDSPLAPSEPATYHIFGRRAHHYGLKRPVEF